MQLPTGARHLAGALFLALLLAACATAPQTQQLLQAPGDNLPARVELTQTPFFPQQRYQCGPAALATVLNARAVSVTPEELVERVYIPALQGSLREEIAATARYHGMLAYPLRPSLADLLEETAHGNPVLVFQNIGLPLMPSWHYAVVIGYDLATREIVLRSGTTRRWRTSLRTFERTWSRGDYWALVILPPGEVPASARPAIYLQAARDLEVSGQAQAARKAYRSATERWPDLPAGWLAWGNSLYADAQFSQAVAAFRQATALAPSDPRSWNNLAYALLETACHARARQAAACAVALAPGEPEYRETQAEIAARTEGTGLRSAQCAPLQCPAAPVTGRD
ncbi:MAG: PA2778 family cysteine peptidase [Gammaproteobacteria bacterium]|jgi:tetratricopeptide (TPR) repeat protein